MMTAGAPEPRRAPMAEINVTPLVDVVLVLLIIFMVMTPLMLKELGVHVPKKEQAEVTEQVSADQHSSGPGLHEFPPSSRSFPRSRHGAAGQQQCAPDAAVRAQRRRAKVCID